MLPGVVGAGVAGIAAMVGGDDQQSPVIHGCHDLWQEVVKGLQSGAIGLHVPAVAPLHIKVDVYKRQAAAWAEKWDGYDNGRIRMEMSIHAEYTSYDKVWHALAEYAINNHLGMQVHVSETKSEHDSCLEKYGLTPAQILDVYHVWDVRALAAHCVHVTEEDMDLLARRGVTAVHCPNSNLKLASGIAPVRKMLDKGINVALGTDGVSSSNNADLFEAVKLAALLSNGSTLDPTSLTAQEALKLATVNGAKAQGRENECGMIAPGMDADLIMLDFTQPHLIPCHNPISNLVYAASGHDVCLTMVRGKILYENGSYPTIDMEAVLREFHDYVIPLMFGADGKEQRCVSETGPGPSPPGRRWHGKAGTDEGLPSQRILGYFSTNHERLTIKSQPPNEWWR